MSNLLDNGYTQLNNLTQINCDDIQTESINTKALYINNILFDNSGADLSNYVTTTELSTQLNPINNNVSTNTLDISGLKFINSTFVTLGTTQQLSGQKSYAALQRFIGNIRCDSSVILNSGNLTVTNAQMQLIPNIGTLITNVTTLSSQINLINTSLGNYVLTTALNNTLLNYITSSFLATTLSGYITTSYLSSQLNNYVTNTYLSSQNYITTSGLILTLSSYVTSSYLNSQLSNYVLSSYLSSQLLNYVSNTNLSTQLLNYVSISGLTLTLSDYIKKSELNLQLSNYALVTSLNTTNNNVTAIQNKLVDIYYDVPTSYFDINHNAHIYGVLKLGLILNVETTINAIGILLGTTSAASIKATADLFTLTTITIPGMNLITAGVILRVDNLETKTTNMTYNLPLNTTYIGGTLSLTTVRLNSLDSGILQTANQSVVFIGETEIRNDFSVTNGFGMSCDGGIIQNNNSQNTFRGGLRVNNTLQCDDFTSGGTNSNINSTNTNINSTTCNITGNTIIKNMSEISSGTIPPYLSILSTKLNTNNRNIQGLLIGKEQLVANEECNCNIGFNYAFGGFENYGYLGLNVNTNDTRECFRWFETGCSLPTGDLTVSTGGIVIASGDIKVNTINNRSTNLNINSAYTLNMNSDTINIGTSQSVVPPAFNSINIGNVASLSIINLNGLVYSPYQMNITGAITQW